MGLIGFGASGIWLEGSDVGEEQQLLPTACGLFDSKAVGLGWDVAGEKGGTKNKSDPRTYPRVAIEFALTALSNRSSYQIILASD